MEKQENAQRGSRHGAWSAGIAALAVAAVILFNLLVAQLPADKMQIDLTDAKIYNITETTRAYLAGLGEDVEIHVLMNRDSVDSRITRFLDKYESLSDRVTLEYTDPLVFPSALTKFGAESGDVVVLCPATGLQEIFSVNDIIGFDEMAYYMYQQVVETDFDAEGLLTSAIDGVVNESSRKAYETTGHDETAMAVSIDELFHKAHLAVEQVNLLTGGGIPEDCDLLILNAPARDLADDELEMLRDYLASGGQVLCNLNYQAGEQPNLEALLAEYGLDVVNGVVADTQRYYQNDPYLFFPVVNNSVDAASSLYSDATVLFFGVKGMTASEPERESITLSPFLTTSEGGVTVTQENQQLQGTFVVGAVATEDVGDGKTARLTVYGADTLINTSITNRFTNLDNTTLFIGSATAGFGDISAISIPPVSLQEEMNTVSSGGLWGLLFIFVIPLALVSVGFIRWLRRRKL